ncbi:unnamed protein product [Zymoseptoria tritici ST99CH_3D1]|uniref:Uncharacterized protein n=1 Tax=Zymoseptoria tritici ST99CH_1E4 TaxID=1276532 RepID=A0A2H1GYV1_ZYMTR|nr:unnamed protein product [Zymoseptoria tritici ST99CH_1E4]SMR61721.1 unnamed protein product [Zymoseptoria tritici ST99CH_3D1]
MWPTATRFSPDHMPQASNGILHEILRNSSLSTWTTSFSATRLLTPHAITQPSPSHNFTARSLATRVVNEPAFDSSLITSHDLLH